jgi:hypothetical protein
MEDFLFISAHALAGLLVIVSFLLRDIWPFDKIWRFFKYGFIMLFWILGANFAKKGIKDWWNED